MPVGLVLLLDCDCAIVDGGELSQALVPAVWGGVGENKEGEGEK